MRLYLCTAVLALVHHASPSTVPLVAIPYEAPGQDLIRSEIFPRDVSTLEKRIDPITLGKFPLSMNLQNQELFKYKFAGAAGTATLEVTCVSCYTSGTLVVSTTPVTQDIGTEIIEIFEHPIGEIITALGLDLKVDIQEFFGHFEFDISFAAHGTYTVHLWPPKIEDPKRQNLTGQNFIGIAPALDLVFNLDAAIDFTTGFEVWIPDAYLIINPITGDIQGSDFTNIHPKGIPVKVNAGSACLTASLRFSVRAGLEVEIDGTGLDLEAGIFLDAPGYKACLNSTTNCGIEFTESLYVDLGVYARAVVELDYKSLSVGPTAVKTIGSLALPSECVQTSTPAVFPPPNSTPISQPPCGAGLLICQVDDPTRLEAPWHGVSAPFPQCYDPALYNCSDSFLCPINAPKIPGQYACGSLQPPCGTDLLICQVEDPTRSEAPWHGVSAPFPQCYDPAFYICSDSFLCPIDAPKVAGQYACGPSQPPCGTGLSICQVEDPTRIEAPWHGVSATFPQCYDPAQYTCASNFLCPINAPKINGEYACGPYGTTCSNWTISSQTLTGCESNLDWCPSTLLTSIVIPKTVCADSAPTTAYSSLPMTITSPVSLSIFTAPVTSVIETVNVYTEIYTRSIWITTTIITSYLSLETVPLYAVASSSYVINPNSTSMAKFTNSTTVASTSATILATSTDGEVYTSTVSEEGGPTTTNAYGTKFGSIIMSVGGYV